MTERSLTKAVSDFVNVVLKLESVWLTGAVAVKQQMFEDQLQVLFPHIPELRAVNVSV